MAFAIYFQALAIREFEGEKLFRAEMDDDREYEPPKRLGRVEPRKRHERHHHETAWQSRKRR